MRFFYKALKEEAEKKRIAKETAERKREQAIQREKERLQELMNKKQEELRLMQADRISESNSANGEYEEEPAVPAIVHDRIKMFKDSERASKERQNVSSHRRSLVSFEELRNKGRWVKGCGARGS